LDDDGRGVGEALNETGLDGKGLIITGTHFVSLIAQEYTSIVTREAQTRIFMPPHVSYSPLTTSVSDYVNNHNVAVSYLQNDLPPNVELITAQIQSDGTVLLRFAHMYAVNEYAELAAPVTFDLSTVFVAAPTSCTELSLTAAYPQGQHQVYQWKTTDGEIGVPKVEKRKPGVLKDTSVTLNPMQIRTYACVFG